MPSGQNPFVTVAALPGVQLTAEQLAAIVAGENPQAENPFITKSALLPTALSSDQKAALDAAQQPGAANPFVTQSSLPASQLQENELAAIQQALAPSAENPFITKAGLPINELSPDQRDALNSAHQPSVGNPFATLADLGQVGLVSRVVAAGNLDLRGSEPSQVLGGLKVIATQVESGLATLAFTGYRFDRRESYIVKALPSNPQASQALREFTCVQFVGFQADGFVLHIAQPLAGTANLGSCMVEVSEMMVSGVELPSLEQAVQYYYSLLQQERYAEAWPMLSNRFKRSINVRTYEKYIAEWKRSGPAIIVGITAEQVTQAAGAVVLELDYPKAISAQRFKKIRYQFEANQQEGHPRFGYWVFVAGNFID